MPVVDVLWLALPGILVICATSRRRRQHSCGEFHVRVMGPVTVGANVKLMVQVAFAAIVPVQVLAEMLESPLMVTAPVVRATVEFVNSELS
jgi:hypothetical protein